MNVSYFRNAPLSTPLMCLWEESAGGEGGGERNAEIHRRWAENGHVDLPLPFVKFHFF